MMRALCFFFAGLAVSGCVGTDAPASSADSSLALTETSQWVSEDLAAARRAFRAPELRPVAFRASSELHFTESVVSEGEVLSLSPSSRSIENLKYSFSGQSRDLHSYLTETYTNAFLVLHRGEVVAEIYRNGANESSRFHVYSISKSIVSMLLGAAIDRGAIKEIDEDVQSYVPELVGSAYDGVTIRQALLMTSGVDFVELGDDGNLSRQIDEFRELVGVTSKMRCVEYAATLNRRRPPGAEFNYATPETCVLSAVIENATGLSLAAFMSEVLWSPIGAEADAFWTLDGPPGIGRAVAGGGFNATLRDLGRLGLLALNNGRANEKQVVSEEWMRLSTTPERGEPVAPAEQWGYQHQWWTLEDSDAFAGHGVYGQFLYIDPDEELVIVKLSYWPTGWDYELEYETMAGFRAIADLLSDQ